MADEVSDSSTTCVVNLDTVDTRVRTRSSGKVTREDPTSRPRVKRCFRTAPVRYKIALNDKATNQNRAKPAKKRKKKARSKKPQVKKNAEKKSKERNAASQAGEQVATGDAQEASCTPEKQQEGSKIATNSGNRGKGTKKASGSINSKLSNMMALYFTENNSVQCKNDQSKKTDDVVLDPFVLSLINPEENVEQYNPLQHGDVELMIEANDLPCPSQRRMGLEIPDMFGKIFEKLSALPRWKFDRYEDYKKTAIYTAGLTDKQWNVYFQKIGYLPILNGKALLRGDFVLIKAGVVRCWISLSDNAGEKTILEAENRKGSAHPINFRTKQLDKLIELHCTGHTLIFPITREYVCNTWLVKNYKPGKLAGGEFPREKVRYIPGEGHMGILIVHGNNWRYMDCNNSPGQSKAWVQTYYSEIKKHYVEILAKKLKCDYDTLEFVPTWFSYGLQHCCALYCMFAVEQLQKRSKNFILNNTIAQSILYFEKVKLFVGGDTNLGEYEKLNPDWKVQKADPFPLEGLLQEVIEGNGKIDYKVEDVQRMIQQADKTFTGREVYVMLDDIENADKYAGSADEESEIECDDY